jgi:hypothetical protein
MHECEPEKEVEEGMGQQVQELEPQVQELGHRPWLKVLVLVLVQEQARMRDLGLEPV